MIKFNLVVTHSSTLIESPFSNCIDKIFINGLDILQFDAGFPITIVAFVDHYQIEGKKYYASGEEVVTPRQMREHAELLKYM